MLGSDLPLAFDILVSLGLLVAMLYFVFVLTLAVTRQKPAPAGPRCERCASGLIPLLDSSHIFHGEAACSRCGTLHEGIDWPSGGPRRVPKTPAQRAGGGRPQT